MRRAGANNPLIHSLSIAQLMEIDEAFSRFDRDGDGHIEHKELAVVMRIMGMQPSKQQLDDLIKSVDRDGNGKIELEEFANLMARQMLLRDGKVELDQAFKLFDADPRGFVTTDEIRELMTTAGGDEALTQEEVNELILHADPSSEGKISLQAFRDLECWKIPDDTMALIVSPRRPSTPQRTTPHTPRSSRPPSAPVATVAAEPVAGAAEPVAGAAEL